MKPKFIYELENEVGEKHILTGITEVCKFIGSTAGTVSLRCDTGRRINGWLINKIGKTSGTTNYIRPIAKNPRKSILDNLNWHYGTVNPKSNVIYLRKTFRIKTEKNIDFKNLDFEVKDYVDKLIKSLPELDDRYILATKIPDKIYDCTDNNLYFFELHIKFLEKDILTNRVNFLKPYIFKLDKLITNYDTQNGEGIENISD